MKVTLSFAATPPTMLRTVPPPRSGEGCRGIVSASPPSPDSLPRRKHCVGQLTLSGWRESLPGTGPLDSHIFQSSTGYGGRSGGKRSAACSAVKATASRCRDLRFAAALTASARCRNGRHDRHLFARELLSRAFRAHQLARRSGDQPPSGAPTLEVGACGRRGTELTRTEVSIMAAECGSERRRSRPARTCSGRPEGVALTAEHAAARSPPDRPSCSAAPSLWVRSRRVRSTAGTGRGDRTQVGFARLASHRIRTRVTPSSDRGGWGCENDVRPNDFIECHSQSGGGGRGPALEPHSVAAGAAGR